MHVEQVGLNLRRYLRHLRGARKPLSAAPGLGQRVNGNAFIAVGLRRCAGGDQVDIITGGREACAGTVKDPAIIGGMAGTYVADSHVPTPVDRIQSATERQRQSQWASPWPASTLAKICEELRKLSCGRSASQVAS